MQINDLRFSYYTVDTDILTDFGIAVWLLEKERSEGTVENNARSVREITTWLRERDWAALEWV